MSIPLNAHAEHACLQALTQVAEQVGFGVPLSRYSPEQARTLVAAIAQAYERALRASASPDFDDPIGF